MSKSAKKCGDRKGNTVLANETNKSREQDASNSLVSPFVLRLRTGLRPGDLRVNPLVSEKAVRELLWTFVVTE